MIARFITTSVVSFIASRFAFFLWLRYNMHLCNSASTRLQYICGFVVPMNSREFHWISLNSCGFFVIPYVLSFAGCFLIQPLSILTESIGNHWESFNPCFSPFLAHDSSVSSDLFAQEQVPASAMTVPARQMQSQCTKLWCHLFLNKPHPHFDLVPIMIHWCDCTMHEMCLSTNVMIRVRGRGSGYLEVGNEEAPLPLMVAVISPGNDPVHFKTVVQMTINNLQSLHQLFVEIYQQRNLSEFLTMESLWRFGEMSKEAEIVLVDLLRGGVLAVTART